MLSQPFLAFRILSHRIPTIRRPTIRRAMTIRRQTIRRQDNPPTTTIRRHVQFFSNFRKETNKTHTKIGHFTWIQILAMPLADPLFRAPRDKSNVSNFTIVSFPMIFSWALKFCLEHKNRTPLLFAVLTICELKNHE